MTEPDAWLEWKVKQYPEHDMMEAWLFAEENSDLVAAIILTTTKPMRSILTDMLRAKWQEHKVSSKE